MGIYHKQLNIIPLNENDRLRKLYKYDILNTPPEVAFDKIAKLAMELFEASSAFISFVDENKVFLKSDTTGQFERYTNREDSLCSWTILQDNVVVFNHIEEASGIIEDPKHLKKSFGVNFFAAAPLLTPDGYKIGALCVADPSPKYPSNKQLEMLSSLGSIVMDELKFRLATRNAVRVQTDLMNATVHDLKNPLTSIKLYAQLIQRECKEQKSMQTMTERIVKSSDFILSSLNDLLNLSQIEDGEMRLRIEPCVLDSLFKELLADFEIIVHQKKQKIIFVNAVQKPVAGDKIRIREIFENLLSNASKYAYPDTTISLIAKEVDGRALIEVRDEGQGLSEEDMKKLFKKFARLSSVPTGKEGSNGLGLSIVKTLVELHNGKIWAESDGKGMGSSFFIALPFASF
ncbi:GAF domain-containing sensor histidine kinase [Olivibacter domesticus]|uniref:histidine kinase n=1 Tax=Olivibacter domesticus TaxID=407022 RepID=A0A1H7PLF1_OLID1|nr:GAF domain-containing sensor histidine kinase [Olivibacter domesticus]SEL36406.1 GAF domain-containing protein [Olivibacter domesticus]